MVKIHVKTKVWSQYMVAGGGGGGGGRAVDVDRCGAVGGALGRDDSDDLYYIISYDII
jgi:hypothetical protein